MPASVLSMRERLQNSDLGARLYGVEITCTDKELLVERTNSGFEENVDIMIEAGVAYAAGRMAKGRFEEIQKAAGQNFNRLGFVADKTLRLHFVLWMC